MTNVKERIGSSKKLVASDTPGEVFACDLGKTSVFDDGPIENFVSERLAIARTTQAACTFEYLRQRGIGSHYICPEGKTSIRVHECRVNDLPLLSGKAFAGMVGLEVLFRVVVSEKFFGRIERSEVSKDDLHLPNGVEFKPGVRLLKPYVEASTKWEDLDGYLTAEAASDLTDMSAAQLRELYQHTAQVGLHLEQMYRDIDCTLVDGKLEYAYDKNNGVFVLIDGISLDELGVTKDDYHYGKNLIRDWYKDFRPDWYAALREAQEQWPEDKSKWPACPDLPKDVQLKHVSNYEEITTLLSDRVSIRMRCNE